VPSGDVPAGGSGDSTDLTAEQLLADGDQSLGDDEQTLADTDQTAADHDQLAAARDQRASEADQRSADQEHAARGPEIDDTTYASTRRQRVASTLDRDLASEARSDTARLRDLNADQRDAAAEQRDLAARERDKILAQLDLRDKREAERPSGGGAAVGVELLLRAAQDREKAAALRERMRALREAAAHDREEAAKDRRRAALDRQDASQELALQGLDHLTGSLRRRGGLAAIQRELDRTARTGESLVVAFVDVDGLRAVNNSDGHQAGDDLLRSVAGRIRSELRSYDLVVRYGGDEFVCSMSGQGAADVLRRFQKISTSLAAGSPGASFTVGVAERASGETLQDLILRADQAMIAARDRSAE
jgi:diguanylate cyclase (GGDEF)-like protein